ncbi:MAG: vWA domain-containing protein [Nannocystaceae bacterium]
MRVTAWPLLLPLALTPALACHGDDGSASASGSESSSITSASAGTAATDTTTTTDGSASATTTTGSGSMSASDSTTTTGSTTVEPTTSEATSEATSDTSDTTSDTTLGTTTTTTTDGSTTDGKVEPCQVEETPIEPIPSDVLFVLDKSGSMSMQLWDHDNNLQTPNVTRWKSLYNVVEGVVTKFDDKLNFGAKLFPKIDAGSYVEQGACEIDPGVEVPVAPNNAVALLAGIPGPDFMVLGGTPSYQALDAGFTYVNTLMTGLDAAVIFITDGEISCDNPPAAAIAAISDAWDKQGVPTYVVGIDVDAQTSAQLDQFAVAGGKPLKNGPYKFYQATDQIELEAAMQSILDDTVSCVLPVDPEPAYPELFEVWLDNAKITEVGDCAKEDGWVWTKPHTEISLCGASCSKLKQGKNVEAKYYCVAG